MTLACPTPLYAPPTPGFTTLPLDFFEAGAAPLVELYAFAEGSQRPRSLASRSRRIEPDEFADWSEAGLSAVLAPNTELPLLAARLEASLDRLLGDASIGAAERFSMLQAVVCTRTEERLRRAPLEAWIAESRLIGQRLVDVLVGSGVTIEAVFDAATHDTTPLAHATNTAAYAVLLAERIGKWSREELAEVAVGALLHDAGKRRLPREVQNKTGPLNAKERALAERHPTLGYEALCESPGVSFGQLMMVYQHHEWVNGEGYPVAILGPEIHPWAKVLAVVNAFDQATARGRTSPGRPANEALLLVAEGAGKQFDLEVVRCWISCFDQKSPTTSGPG